MVINLIAIIIIVGAFGTYLYREFRNIARYMENDKKLHVFVSMGLVIVFSVVFGILYGFEKSIGYAMIITMFIGICKELYDKLVRKTGFSIEDLVADFYGIVYAIVVLAVLSAIRLLIIPFIR